MMNQEKAADERLNYIRCWVRGTLYALEMGRVRSVERTTRLEVALGQHGFVGWLPTAVERIPVYSLAERLGYEAEPLVGLQRVVVLHDPVRSWALLVDQVAQVLTTTWGQLLPLPLSVKNGRSRFFQGVLRQGGETALLLAPDQLHPEAAPILPQPPAPRPSREVASVGVKRERHIVVFALPGFEDVAGRPLRFGLSSTQVAEIVDLPSLIPLPDASPYVLGLAQWRGQTVPVVRLRVGRDGGRGDGDRNGRLRLIITRVPETGALAGLLVKSDMRMLDLPVPHRPSDRELPLDPALISGCVELARETLVIPNIDAALQPEAIAALV